MNDIHQPIIAAKMSPKIQSRSTSSALPPVHMIKVERGLIQRSLLYCFEKGYFSLIRYLLQSGSADSRERDNESRTGLMYCCFIDNDCWAQNIAMTLIEYGAKIEDEDQNGLNALHYAIITQKPILVRRYLAALDFDLSRTVDIYGNTCLHYACSTGNTEIVRLILDAMKRYSVDLTIKNHAGLTACDVVCQLKHERCENLLRNELRLNERNNRISTRTNVSNASIKSMNERRLSIPVRVNSITSTTHFTESISSVPIIMTSSKNVSTNFPALFSSSKENIVKPSTPVFVDPIKSRRMTLKRNENLDLTLTNQIKNRADFAASQLVSQSSVFSLSSSTWREEFSNMIHELQTYTTPSYKKTVHPPLSTELPHDLYETGSEMYSIDGHDIYHQSQSSFRTNLSQKVTHRRMSISSAAGGRKMKK